MLRALSDPERRDAALVFVCKQASPAYAERRAIMQRQARERATAAARRAGGGPKRGRGRMQRRQSYNELSEQTADDKLAFSVKLLEVMAHCTMDNNITEAMCRSIYPPEDVLAAIVDPETIDAVWVALVQFFTNSFIESGFKLEGSLKLISHFIDVLTAAGEISYPPNRVFRYLGALLNAVTTYYSLRYIDEFVTVTSKRCKGMRARTDDLCAVLAAILANDHARCPVANLLHNPSAYQVRLPANSKQ